MTAMCNNKNVIDLITKRLTSFFVFYLTCIYYGYGICDERKSNNVDHTDTKNVWKKFDNEILKKIIESQRTFNSSNLTIESLYKAVINNDLRSFHKSGITSDMIQSASSYGVRYQLINNSLYRDKNCMFPTRCEGIEHFLLKFTNLSNYDVIVNVRDHPQLHKLFNNKFPVFSFSKTDEYLDVMYPAWSFWCGGPAIKLHPTGIGRWDKLRKSLIKEAETWLWEKKKEKAFFRGSRTSEERDELIYLSRESPDLIDAAYTKNQAWKSQKDTLNVDPAEEVSFEKHCRYKYLFNFRGVAASFRFKHLFLCKSLVLHVGEEWKEFFYPLLKPWVHYVPIDSNYKRNDIRNILEFFKNHDNLAKTIAENGYNFIKTHLKLDDVSWYWNKLLQKYIKLQKFVPTLKRDLIKVS